MLPEVLVVVVGVAIVLVSAAMSALHEYQETL